MAANVVGATNSKSNPEVQIVIDGDATHTSVFFPRDLQYGDTLVRDIYQQFNRVSIRVYSW